MSGYALSSELFDLSERNDRRFKRLLSGFGLPALLLGIIIPFLHITQVLDDVVDPIKRFAKLLPPVEEKKKEPEPEPPKPVIPKPQLTPEQKLDKARKKVEKMMSQFDELDELRDVTLDTPANLNTEIITSNTRSTRVIDATKTTGGIGDTSVVDRETSTNIGSRSTTSVKSTISTGGGSRSGSGGGGRVAGRSDEEIQIVFDRTKGAFYAMYTREQRKRPDMVGKLVVRLTILPSGKVKSATLVSSELNNPEFEQKVIARVLLMDFGAKDVGDVTLNYPLYFFPT